MFPEVHTTKSSQGQQPCLKIINEPENKFRFRYASETGSHGAILGREKEMVGKKSKKTYPTVKLENYNGKSSVVVRASLYTLDYEKHVLELKGKSVKNGMSYQVLDNNFTAKFNNLVIVNKKKDIVHEMLMEKKISNLGRSISAAARKEFVKKHCQEVKDRAKEILSSVVICFEAFLDGYENKPIGEPSFSEAIYNQKSSLKITRISRVAGNWQGGDEVILLCDKVKRDSIQVLFFEDSPDEKYAWEGKGVFTPADIHHQVAITFKTPRYKENINVEKPVSVCLCQGDDKSESVTFTYLPDECYDLITPSKKRKRSIKEKYQNVMETPSSSSNDASSELPNDDISVPSPNYNTMLFLNKLIDSNDSQQVAENNHLQERIPAMECAPIVEYAIGDVYAALDIDPETVDLLSSIEDIPLSNFNLLEDFPIPFETDGGYPQPENRFILNNNDVVDSSIKAKSCISSSNLADDLRKISLVPSVEMACENYGKPSGQMDIGSHLRFLSHKDSDKVVNTMEEEKPKCQKLSMIEVQTRILELLHWRDSLNNTILHWTVFHNKNVKLFLIMDERLHTNILNVQNYRKQTALHIALEKKNKEFVQLLLKYGADPNLKDSNGNNCLHIAAKNKFPEGLCEIIHSPRFHGTNAFNYEGLTPIHLAAIHQSDLGFCALIRESDLSVLDQKTGRSVLHFAIEMLPKYVTYLLAQDCVDVNSQDFSGNTPLHLACSIGNLQLVKLLLSNFADPLLKNFKQGFQASEQETSDDETNDAYNLCDVDIEEIYLEGETPMDVATDHRITEVLKSAIEEKDQSKCFHEANVKELCGLLDKQLDIASWRKIIECMGMDASVLDTLLVCSSQSPSKAVLNYLKKEHGENYMIVLENLFTIAGLGDSAKLIQRMCR